MSFQSELRDLINIREIAERKIAKLIFETIIKPVIDKDGLELCWYLQEPCFTKDGSEVVLGPVYDAVVVCEQIITQLNLPTIDPIRWIMMTICPNAWWYNSKDGFYNKDIANGNGRQT